MNISLTPQLEAIIRQKVESGLYSDASEVVREALRMLDERDRHARLKAAIAIGEEQYARGEVTVWTAGTLDEIQREADEEDRQQLPIIDDVQP